jgi:8-oxo-dGTP pyrophosphatase MutT (NUDIX family)
MIKVSRGGGIDEGENEIAGLIRELKEETGAQGVRKVEAFILKVIVEQLLVRYHFLNCCR